MIVSDIYNTQAAPIYESMTVQEALQILVTKHYNGVIVVNKKGSLVGILSLQDIAAAIVPIEMREHINLASAMYKPSFFQEQCDALKNSKVKEIMRKDFIVATPTTSVMEVAADFLRNGLYLVPICEKGKVIGVVTRSEIKKALAWGMGVPFK